MLRLLLTLIALLLCCCYPKSSSAQGSTPGDVLTAFVDEGFTYSQRVDLIDTPPLDNLDPKQAEVNLAAEQQAQQQAQQQQEQQQALQTQQQEQQAQESWATQQRVASVGLGQSQGAAGGQVEEPAPSRFVRVTRDGHMYKSGGAGSHARSLRYSKDGQAYMANSGEVHLGSAKAAAADMASGSSQTGQGVGQGSTRGTSSTSTTSSSSGSSSSTSTSTTSSTSSSSTPSDLGLGTAQRSTSSSSTSSDLGLGPAQHSTSSSSTPSDLGLGTAQRSLQGIIGGVDSRIDCPRSPTFPFTAVGQLDVTSGGGQYICSGTMVGPDVVLTAAHCVYSRELGMFYSRLDFSPSRSHNPLTGQMVSPYGTVPWIHVTLYVEYLDVDSQNASLDMNTLDIAVIKLGVRMGEATGWLGLARPCVPDQDPQYVATTAGYPSDFQTGSCKTTTCSVTQSSCTAQYLFHTCDTVRGQSGSSLWHMAFTPSMEIGAYVRGVHNLEWQSTGPGGEILVYTNSAVAITPFHYASIMSWIAPSFNAGDPEVAFPEYPVVPVAGSPTDGRFGYSSSSGEGASQGEGDLPAPDDF